MLNFPKKTIYEPALYAQISCFDQYFSSSKKTTIAREQRVNNQKHCNKMSRTLIHSIHVIFIKTKSLRTFFPKTTNFTYTFYPRQIQSISFITPQTLYQIVLYAD
jgi:hypothetical protein